MSEPNWCAPSCTIGSHDQQHQMSMAALSGDYEDVALTYQVDPTDLYNHIINEHYKPNEADVAAAEEASDAEQALLDDLDKIEDESELLSVLNRHVVKIMARKLKAGSLREAIDFMDQLRKNIMTRQKLRTEGSTTGTTINVNHNQITVVQGQLEKLWKAISTIPPEYQDQILQVLETDDGGEQLVIPERTQEIMDMKPNDDMTYVTELQKESGKELE